MAYRLAIFITAFLSCVQICFAANEDFTTYSETDDSGTMTVTSSKVTFTSTPFGSVSENHNVQKDFGAGHFEDFEHLFTTNLIASDLQAGTPWSMDNDGIGSDGFSGGQDILVYYIETDADPAIWDSASFNYDAVGGVYDPQLNTDYFITLARNGSTLTAEVYEDSGRTQLADTLSITCSTTAFQYLHVATGYPYGTSETSTGYIENLDIQEGGGGGSTIGKVDGVDYGNVGKVAGISKASIGKVMGVQ